LPIQQATILQERDGRRLGTGLSQGHHLKGLVATANDAQQGLCVSGFRVADDGNLLGLREGVS